MAISLGIYPTFSDKPIYEVFIAWRLIRDMDECGKSQSCFLLEPFKCGIPHLQTRQRHTPISLVDLSHVCFRAAAILEQQQVIGPH